MYHDRSTKDKPFPKTLLVRNEPGGMIWQVYHVNNKIEAIFLSINATRNGFFDISLVDLTDNKETWPDWRENSTIPEESAMLIDHVDEILDQEYETLVAELYSAINDYNQGDFSAKTHDSLTEVVENLIKKIDQIKERLKTKA